MKRPNITPGPWVAKKELYPRPVSKHSSATFTRVSPGPEGNAIIALVPPIYGPVSNGLAISNANARAIAAVPETHKALERALATLERLAPSLESRDVETVEIIRSALIAAGYQL